MKDILDATVENQNRTTTTKTCLELLHNSLDSYQSRVHVKFLQMDEESTSLLVGCAVWWCASIREDVRESRGVESREKDEKRG